MTIIAPTYVTSANVSKILRLASIIWNCCFILSPMVLFSTLYAKVIISYSHIIKMHVTLIIETHTKPCIASLAFTACNWLQYRLDIAIKESF